MTYQLTVDQRPGFLYCVVTGENTSANVVAYLSEMLRECSSRGCFRVLIDERLEGPRLRISDVFQIASDEGKRALGVLEAIAYVDANASGDLMQFAETVAVNRGLPLRVCRSVAEAEQWLLAQDTRQAPAPTISP